MLDPGHATATPPAPARLRAPAVWTLCAITLVVSAAHWLSSAPGPFGGAAGGALWRLASASWLHQGPLHLSVNLVFLLWLGPRMEQRLGSASFVAFYVAAGVFAHGLSEWLAPPGVWGASVGASGAIVAMLTASSLWFPRSAVDLYGCIPTPLPAIAAALLVSDAAVLLHGHSAAINSGVHLSGAVFGLVLGGAALWLPRAPRPRWRNAETP